MQQTKTDPASTRQLSSGAGTDPSEGCIKHQAPKADVQHAMNIAIGYTRWYGGRKDLRWINLLAARNLFVEYHLQQKMSITQYKQLKLSEKQDQVQRLCQAFIREFFHYTRDGSWMQEAVGEDFSWVHIDGMSDWHIKAALHSLQGAQDSREAALLQPPTVDVESPPSLCNNGGEITQRTDG